MNICLNVYCSNVAKMLSSHTFLTHIQLSLYIYITYIFPDYVVLDVNIYYDFPC